jgi:DNA-binding IclR family transcriptional regulator
MILEKCAAVLRVAAAGPLTVSGVAASLGMPKSTVSRLLAAMARSGLLEPLPGQRGFSVGAVVIGAARAGTLRRGLVDRLDEMVAEIVNRFGHTGYVSILDGAEVIAVRVREGSNALRVVTPPGTRYPAFATSTGRALLARLDDAEVRRLHPEPLLPPCGAAPRAIGELMKRLSRVRRMGIAHAEGEANRGAGNLAVAVVDAARSQSAAACISFPSAVCDAAERAAIAEALIAGARQVGSAVGDPAWLQPPEVVEKPRTTTRRRAA